MSDEKTIADRMFRAQPAPPQFETTLADDRAPEAPAAGPKQGEPAPKPGKPGVEADPRPRPPEDRMFREGGDPPKDLNYGPVLRNLFDGVEYNARYDGDEKRIEMSEGARKGLNEVLGELEVGELHARNIITMAQAYGENPHDPEVSLAEGEKSVATLREEWGEDADNMILGARQIVAAAAEKTPGLMDFLQTTGMGNDVRLIRTLGLIAKRKGLAK